MLSATATDDGLPPPPALTYLWELTSGNAADVVIANADQLATDVTFNANAAYVLTLSVSDGALTTKAEVNVGVAVGVQDNLEPAMRIYPNPASEKLTLELVNIPGNSSIVSIYDLTGGLIYNKQLSSEMTEIDISAFNDGLYFIKVVSEDYTFTQRVEIHK